VYVGRRLRVDFTLSILLTTILAILIDFQLSNEDLSDDDDEVASSKKNDR